MTDTETLPPYGMADVSLYRVRPGVLVCKEKLLVIEIWGEWEWIG